jgi:hypothetical protein
VTLLNIRIHVVHIMACHFTDRGIKAHKGQKPHSVEQVSYLFMVYLTTSSVALARRVWCNKL